MGGVLFRGGNFEEVVVEQILDLRLLASYFGVDFPDEPRPGNEGHSQLGDFAHLLDHPPEIQQVLVPRLQKHPGLVFLEFLMRKADQSFDVVVANVVLDLDPPPLEEQVVHLQPDSVHLLEMQEPHRLKDLNDVLLHPQRVGLIFQDALEILMEVLRSHGQLAAAPVEVRRDVLDQAGVLKLLDQPNQLQHGLDAFQYFRLGA